MAVYQRSEDLINIGAYVAGSDAETDLAIKRHPEIRKILQQGMNESTDIEAVKEHIDQLVGMR